jgi:hypothetical protein
VSFCGSGFAASFLKAFPVALQRALLFMPYFSAYGKKKRAGYRRKKAGGNGLRACGGDAHSRFRRTPRREGRGSEMADSYGIRKRQGGIEHGAACCMQPNATTSNSLIRWVAGRRKSIE